MYRKLVLDNGVRVVTERMPSAKSVTVGIWVNVGSRDEARGEEGFSHFIEHMFFKGTRTRSAMQISREIDALGGEMNAFTGRETTTFYVKVLDQHLPQALALLSDLFHHAKFAQKEIEKEKQVVLEEVRMVEDDPEDLAQDWHMEQALNGHPLGRPILGQAAVIRTLKRERLLRFVQTHYHPAETVISVAGNFNMTELARLLDVSIAAVDEESAQKAKDMISRLTEEVEVGKIYLGTVRKIMDFGAFVEILPGTDGLVHISQLAHHRVKAVSDEVAEGDQIMVKVLEVDKQGKIRLSRKETMPAPTAPAAG